MDQFKYKHSDASELVEPMIDAILQNPSNKEALQKSDNKFLNKAFQMAMVHENPKYFSQLCLVLQENNLPISQEIIRFAIEIYCSKESSYNTRELIETRLQLIFTKIEKLDLEKRLVAILGERESRNRNPKFLQPIIAVTADLSNAALMAALKAQEFFKTDKADIVFSLCAALQVKQPVPPVPEDTLILAINELVPTMNNNYHYDGEAEKLAREMVCAVLHTVIASGNPVSGKTLLAMAAKQPQNSMFAQPIIDGIKKKNGDLPIETLESIFALKAARAYAGGISKLLLERKIQIPEKFIILANDQRSGNELILQMLHDVVASGAKVSELTLQAVLNNSNNKDLISPVIDAIIKTNTKTNTPLSFETLSKLLTTMKLSSSAQLSFHETSRVSAKELNNLKIKLFEAYLKSGNSLTTEAQSLAKLHGITDEVQKIANNDIIRVADKKDVLEV